MTPDYEPREVLEHEHRTHELLEHGANEPLRFVPLFAAVLAVLAGLSSLYGGRLSERMLTLKNEAVLSEVAASDLWSEYQAESVKAHIYETIGQTQSGPRAASMSAKAAQYRKEQAPLRDEAHRYEASRDHDLAESSATERRKLQTDAAVALFEIAIVLTSVAALTRRPWLLALAAVGGIAGVYFILRGVIGAA